MSGTLETPELGQPNSTQDPKVKAAIETLNGLLNGENKLAAAGLGSEVVESSKIKNGAVTSSKLKPTVGIKTASAGINGLTESYQDISGTTLEINPSVASYLKVTAVFRLGVVGNTESFAAGPTICAGSGKRKLLRKQQARRASGCLVFRRPHSRLTFSPAS